MTSRPFPVAQIAEASRDQLPDGQRVAAAQPMPCGLGPAGELAWVRHFPWRISIFTAWEYGL